MPVVTSAVNTNVPVTQQLSNGNGAAAGAGGTSLGVSAADRISFYNAPPIPQPSGSGQALPNLNATTAGNGNISEWNLTASPTAVTTITTVASTVTVTGVLATDILLAMNKPTAQAGLALCSGRVSAANTIELNFGNGTGATVTPTASELYIFTTVSANMGLTATLTPAAVAANTTVEQFFTVTGVQPGMLVAVNKPTSQSGLGVMGARVAGNNTVGITFANFTAATITPTAAELYSFAAFTSIAAVEGTVLFGVNVGTTLAAGVATITSSEIAPITVSGLAATDVIVGVSKPTAQAGLGIVGQRVSAANALSITFMNPTVATVTPTASEVYSVTVLKANLLPALITLTQNLAPVSVAANTSAEQTFTVTGLVGVNNPVLINKPTAQPGLAIAGVRISAANTLAINYVNVTAAAIVPATEVYTIGQFNQAVQGVTKGFVTQVTAPGLVGIASSFVYTQAALVALGLVAGK